MWIALAFFAVLATATVYYLRRYDGRFEVERQQEFEAPIRTVFEAVSDFRTWPEWSPWLLHEPDARISFSDDCKTAGGYYSWEGKHVGAGRLTHVALEPATGIEQQIDFLRPFRARNRIDWSFEDLGETTRANWRMSGRMPLPFRFMAARIEPVVGRDFELGLARLAGFLNPDAAHPSFEFGEVESLENFSYWAIPFNGNRRQLGPARKSGIETLIEAARGKSGLGLTLYHGFDPMAARFRAEIAVPVGASAPPSNYTRREFSGGPYLKLTLRGDHRFLMMGWHLLYSHCRMTRTRLGRNRPALEIYQDDPAETPDSNRVRTALYVPVTR